VLTIVYVAQVRMVDVVAPQCAGGDACVVQVNAPVEGFVVVVLVLVVCLFSAMGLTGVALLPNFGNGTGLSPMHDDVVAAEKPSIPGQASVRVQSATHSRTDGISSDSRVAPEGPAVWRQLPLDMQDEAVAYAEEAWGVSERELQDATVEIAHEPGRGNKPYFVKFDLSDKGERVLKLSKGGRGKDGVSVRGISD